MNDADNDILVRLQSARRLAHDAGQLTLGYFRQAIHIERKSDDSPVTIADRQAERLLRERIADAFPEDAVLGEEYPETPGRSGFRWILDPIDGTKSFISGVPLFGTIIGIEREGQSVVGVICVPGLRETVFAARGHGAWYACGDDDPQPARVSDCPRLAEGLFVTSEINTFCDRGAMPAYERLQEAAWVSRTWGDCYGYLLVATGRAAAMVDPIMNVWDAAGISPILEEAGGTFTDWQGQPTIYGGEGIGTNGRVLDEVLAITRQFPGTAG